MVKMIFPNVNLVFTRVKDGFAIEGLEEGIVAIDNDISDIIDSMNNDNSFYPYRLKCLGFCASNQWWIYEVVMIASRRMIDTFGGE